MRALFSILLIASIAVLSAAPAMAIQAPYSQAAPPPVTFALDLEIDPIANAAYGDADADGDVDLDDFRLLKDAFGATGVGAWSQGDFTGDGAVDLTDFRILKDNFGAFVPPPAAGSTPVTPIPEPATLATLGVGIGSLAGYAAKKRKQ